MAGQTVNVAVLAETGRFVAGMNSAGKTADGFGSKFSKVGLAVGAAVVGVGLAVGKFVKDSIDAAAASEVVAAQTEAVVKSTGAAAGRSADQIGDLALKLSNLTGVDDEVVQGAENMLLTFTNIKGDQFDKATAAALDMSQALGTDANAAAQQLGKALNDPINGVSKLTRSGVTFTDQQKQQIATMQKAGDVAGAQGIILSEVAKEFGGSAEAFGATLEGTRAKIGNAFGNIQETIGGAFLPVLTLAGSKIATFLQNLGQSDRFTGFVQGIADGITAILSPSGPLGTGIAFVQSVIGTLAPIFSAAFTPLLPVIEQLGGAFLQLAPQVSPFGIILHALLPIIPQLVSTLAQLAGGVLGALGSTFATLAPIISQVSGQLVGLLSGVFVAVLPTVLQLVSALGAALVQLAPVFGQLVGVVALVVSQLVAALVPVILQLVTTLLPPLAAVFTTVVAAIVPLVAQIVTALMPAFQAILPVILPVVQMIATLLIPIIQALLPVVTTVFNAIVPIISAALKIVQGIIQVVTGIITGNWSQVWKGLQTILSGVWDAIRAVITGALSIIRAVITAGLNVVRAVFSSVWNAIRSVVTGVTNGIVSAVRGMASGIGDGIGRAVSFVSSLGSKITGALSNAGSLLLDAGGRVIDGFVRGISNSMGAIGNIASKIGNSIMSGVKSILGIHSPSREMAKLGAFSIDGFAKGLSDLSPVQRAMRDMTDLVTAPITPTAFAADGGSLLAPNITHVHVPMLQPSREAGRVIAESMDEWRRVNGNRP